MGTDEDLKFLPIVDFGWALGSVSGGGFDIAGLGFALTPQVDGVAADVEQLTGFAFLESVQLDRLHHFASKVVTIGFSHGEGGGKGTLLVCVLTVMNAAISVWKTS